MIAERNPEIRKATDALYTLSADPAVRAEYEKAWQDSILNSMEEQGEGSKQILQSVGTVNELTHQVREAARRMVETTKEAMHKTDDLETRAFTDDLTGVRNREYFNEAAGQELRYCVEANREFNLIAFSVNNLRPASA